MAAGNRALAFLSLDDQTKAGFASFKRSLGEAGNLLGGFKAQLAGVLSVGTGVAFLASTTRQLDDLADAAERTGRSAAELAELQFAFKVTGANADDVGRAMRALSLELSKAKQGSKEQAELFKALDIDVSGLNDATDALEALAGAFPRLSDLDRLRVARELLGKGGEALVPALKNGPAALRELREEARRLFPVNDEATKAANEFGDAWDRAALALRGQTLPALTELLKLLGDVANDAAEGAKAGSSFAGSLAAAFGTKIATAAGVSPAEQIREARVELEKMGRLTEMFPGGIFGTLFGVRESLLLDKIDAAKAAQRREALQGRTGGEFLDVRDRQLRVQAGLEGGRLKLPSEGDNSALKKAFSDAEKLRQADIQGWIRHADAVFEAADAENLALAKISDDFFAEQERLRQEDIRGWIAYADAVFEAADAENLALAKLSETSRETSDIARELGLTFSSAAEDAITDWENLGDVIKGVEKDLLRLGTRKLVTEPLLGKFEEILKGATGEGGTGGGDLFGSIVGGLGKFIGFAQGGSFMVGGGGGTDSQLVAFRATPGERVTVSTPQQAGGGGPINITVNVPQDTSRASSQQIAAEVGRSVDRALRRNG